MTGFQQIIAVVSLAYFGYLLWPSLSGVASRVYNSGASFLAGRQAGGVTTTTTAGITAEQAQAAELILSRYIAKADKSDPTFKLIVNGIQTLADQTK